MGKTISASSWKRSSLVACSTPAAQRSATTLYLGFSFRHSFRTACTTSPTLGWPGTASRSSALQREADGDRSGPHLKQLVPQITSNTRVQAQDCLPTLQLCLHSCAASLLPCLFSVNFFTAFPHAVSMRFSSLTLFLPLSLFSPSRC